MKRYIVYAEKANGDVDRFETYAEGKREAERKILANWKEYRLACAFDYKFH